MAANGRTGTGIECAAVSLAHGGVGDRAAERVEAMREYAVGLSWEFP